MRLRRMIRYALWVMVAIAAVPLFLIVVYRLSDPKSSAHMAVRMLKNGDVRHEWVPLKGMSRYLPMAVITSEDGRFCQHWGVDWRAVERVWDRTKGGQRLRGASTIPMQAAKNLFLWPGRSYVRKVLEVPLAYAMTLIWPKRRMMEIYLNIVEWGPGIFGAEAAARHHFKKSVSKLTAREAALLAASLPNPFVRRAGRPGPLTRKVARVIERRMKGSGAYIGCVSSRKS